MPTSSLLARFRLPFLLVLLAVTYGTVGYRLIEGWSMTDAFYMTVITLTTVGFREVGPLGTGGKLFTISLIAWGVGTIAFTVSATTELVVSGELTSYLKRRRMDKRFGNLRDHYIVCAYGRVGRAAVRQLREGGAPFVVIDADTELVPLLEEHDVPYLIADPTDEAVLRQLAVDRARGLLCAVDSDAVNVFITLTARALNPGLTIIARASNPASVDKLLRAGADHVVSPYEVSGRRMGVLALQPGVVDFLDLARIAPGLRLEEVAVRAGSLLDGQPIKGIRSVYPSTTILVLRRQDAEPVVLPGEDIVLAAGDLLIVLGPLKAVEALGG